MISSADSPSPDNVRFWEEASFERKLHSSSQARLRTALRRAAYLDPPESVVDAIWGTMAAIHNLPPLSRVRNQLVGPVLKVQHRLPFWRDLCFEPVLVLFPPGHHRPVGSIALLVVEQRVGLEDLLLAWQRLEQEVVHHQPGTASFHFPLFKQE
jgi:hypothetical protein